MKKISTPGSGHDFSVGFMMKWKDIKQKTLQWVDSHDLYFIFVSCAEQQGAAACHTDLLLDVHANF